MSTSTALTGDTGEHVIIAPAAREKVKIHLPDWVEQRCRRLSTIGDTALAVAATGMVSYVFVEWLTEVRAPVTTLLLTLAAVVWLIGGSMRVRAHTSRLHAEVQIGALCRIRREIRSRDDKLVGQLREDLEAQIDRCAAEVQSELAEIRRVVADHATAASIVAQASNGNGVRHLHPGRPGPRDGS